MGNPCPGFAVTTAYGVPGDWAAGFHTGADYAAPSGTPVVAAAAGTVVLEGWNDDYGNFLEIETSGIRHRYCHMRAPALLVNGMHADRGQLLGYVGSTGRSTGPHLHYEERTDPFGYHDHRAPQFNTDGGTPGGGEDDDMTPEQAATLDNVAWLVQQIKGQTDQISPRLMTPVDQTNWGVMDEAAGLRAMMADVIEVLGRIEQKLSP